MKRASMSWRLIQGVLRNHVWVWPSSFRYLLLRKYMVADWQ